MRKYLLNVFSIIYLNTFILIYLASIIQIIHKSIIDITYNSGYGLFSGLNGWYSLTLASFGILTLSFEATKSDKKILELIKKGISVIGLIVCNVYIIVVNYSIYKFSPTGGEHYIITVFANIIMILATIPYARLFRIFSNAENLARQLRNIAAITLASIFILLTVLPWIGIVDITNQGMVFKNILPWYIWFSVLFLTAMFIAWRKRDKLKPFYEGGAVMYRTWFKAIGISVGIVGIVFLFIAVFFYEGGEDETVKKLADTIGQQIEANAGGVILHKMENDPEFQNEFRRIVSEKNLDRYDQDRIRTEDWAKGVFEEYIKTPEGKKFLREALGTPLPAPAPAANAQQAQQQQQPATATPAARKRFN